MSQQANVFHYQSATTDRLFIMTSKGVIKIEGGEFATSNEKIAKEIEASKSFRLGKVWRSEGVIVGSNKRTVSGARGTSKPKDLTASDKIASMRAMGLPDEVIKLAEEKLAKK